MAMTRIQSGGGRAVESCSTAGGVALSLDAYLTHGRRGHYACVSCGEVTEPRPLSSQDVASGRERRCGSCGQESAVTVDQAVREGWLRVLDADGQLQNDTRQSTSAR